MNALTPSEIHHHLMNLHSWDYNKEKRTLRRRVSTNDYAQSCNIVSIAVNIATSMNHHPHLCFGYNYVSCEITTHDANAVTIKDIEFAERFNTDTSKSR